MFKLKPGDGAIGGHQGAVAGAYDDFEKLAREIAKRIKLSIPSKTRSRNREA
jgi:chromosome partitioning protein